MLDDTSAHLRHTHRHTHKNGVRISGSIDLEVKVRVIPGKLKPKPEKNTERRQDPRRMMKFERRGAVGSDERPRGR
jgi:hypothetical protein